jgi:hypothetical protein
MRLRAFVALVNFGNVVMLGRRSRNPESISTMYARLAPTAVMDTG